MTSGVKKASCMTTATSMTPAMPQQYMMPALASASAKIMPKTMVNSMKTVNAMQKLIPSILRYSPAPFFSVSMILLLMAIFSYASSCFLISPAYLREITISSSLSSRASSLPPT